MFLIRCDVEGCTTTEHLEDPVSTIGDNTAMPDGWALIRTVRRVTGDERAQVLTERGLSSLPQLESPMSQFTDVVDEKVFRICSACVEQHVPKMKPGTGDDYGLRSPYGGTIPIVNPRRIR